MNTLRDAIELAMKDIHIETGKDEEFIKVVNRIEIEVSKMVVSQDVNQYDESRKDFSDYDLFEQ